MGEQRIDLSEPILKQTVGVLRDTFNWDGYSIYDMREKLGRITHMVTERNRRCRPLRSAR